MGLILIGLNHKTASLPVREEVAYSPEEAEAALKRLKDLHQVPQAFLLSTCNRTELYAMVADADAVIPQIKEAMFHQRLSDRNGSRDDLLYLQRDAEAVKHLFRVACGLDSLVLGEQEILGQVKSAIEISRNAETVGTIFDRLANHTFKVGKRARSETRIGHGAISVAYAAVELAEKIYQSLEGGGALLVGAGENGALCAQHLLSRKVAPFFIANRTLERAEKLARRLGGETVAFDDIERVLARVDIVVSTTGASGTIIEAETVRNVMKKRDGRALAFIDIAVPRDIDPDVDSIPNVFRFDMDALDSIVDLSLSRRRGEVPTVEKMIDSEVEGFMKWWAGLASGPVIRDLHETFEAIREREVARNEKRFKDADREQLEVFTRNLIRKLLSGPAQRIKQYRAGDPVEMERLAALREVFHLDEGGGEDDGEDSR
jgi:glutamyl-tRNA reductase